MSPSHAEVGLAGERLAARMLTARGLLILGRRVPTAQGEIDLVLLDGPVLVCAEVKTSLAEPGGRWCPGDRWSRGAFARLRAAGRELSRRGLGRGEPRLDLVEIWIGTRGAARWKHHRGLRAPPGCESSPRTAP